MTENFQKDRVTVLIDGNSVIYRAFYNVPPLTANGVPTGVIHIFLSVLEKLRKNPEISDIIIIFDAMCAMSFSSFFYECRCPCIWSIDIRN